MKIKGLDGEAMLPRHIFKKVDQEVPENKIGKIFPEFAKNSDNMPGPDFSNIEIEKLKKQVQGMQDLNKDLEVQAKEIIAENEKLKAQLEKGNKKELLEQIKQLEDKVAELELQYDDDNVEPDPVEQEGEEQEESDGNSTEG
jgi:predicted RNase H-like nuclease (RuvC/YqgF family)